MQVQHQRRSGEERRSSAVYYRYGSERRNNTGNRRLETVEELRPYFTRGTAQRSAEASDRAAEIIKEIAEAFGLQADSLELVEKDDLVDTVEICQSCTDAARRIEELEAELAEQRNKLERYRNQVTALLQSCSSRSQ